MLHPRKLSLTFVLVALVALACGEKQPAASPPPAPAESAAAPASTAAAEPAPAETGAAAAAEPAPTASAAKADAPAKPSLRVVCEQNCSKLGQKCSASVAESCKRNCEQYERVPQSCDAPARVALTCQNEAKDFQCANVAPESCTKLFLRMAACQKSPDTFQAEAGSEASKAAPAGFERYEDRAAGFAALMPKGVTKTQEGNVPVWSVNVGSVRYVIKKQPPSKEKFTGRTQVRLAGEWLKPCSLKMKLHGQLDKGDRTSVHYDVGCKDAGERHGMFHITPSAVYVVGVEAPAGEKGELDAFIYGFELL